MPCELRSVSRADRSALPAVVAVGLALSVVGCSGKERPFADDFPANGVSPGAELIPAAPDAGAAFAPSAASDCESEAGCATAAVGVSCRVGARACSAANGPLACVDGRFEVTEACAGSCLVDATCPCVPGLVEPCETHPGRDGVGVCRAGSRTCIGGSGNTSSTWGTCQDSIAPRARDCRSSADNDCDGAPDDRLDATTCVCSPGSTRPCGAPAGNGCALLQQTESCEVLANGSSTRWGECTFADAGGSVCDPLDLVTGTSIQSVSVVEPFAYFIDMSGAPEVARVPTQGGGVQLVAGPGVAATLSIITGDREAIFGAEGPTSIGRMPLLGDRFSIVAGSETDTHVITALRLNSTHLFTASVGSRTYIQRAPKAGGTAELLIESLALRSDDFEADEEHVFLLSQSDVSRIPVGGGAAESVAVWDSLEEVADFSVGPGYVALATNQRLARAAKSGGVLTTLSSGNAYRVATLDNFIYYFRSASGGGAVCANGSELLRVSQAGGAVTVVAREPAPCVRELVTSDRAVFWITGDRAAMRTVSP